MNRAGPLPQGFWAEYLKGPTRAGPLRHFFWVPGANLLGRNPWHEAMPRPDPPDTPVERTVLSTVRRSGVMGITAKQIATVTGQPESEVTQAIEQLETTGAVHPVGRSLWIAQEYENIGSRWEEGVGPEDFRGAFEREIGISVTSRPLNLHFRPNEQLAVHRWWPYVQGFSAGFVRESLANLSIGKGSVVLDPFCGSGTVPVEARLAGAQGVGNDMLPLAAFVSSAKGEWEVDPRELGRLADRVLRDRDERTSELPFLKETRSHFRPEVLASLLSLRNAIDALPSSPGKDLLRLSFADILIDASNLKRSPCLGYAAKGRFGSERPIELFQMAIDRMREDLAELQKDTGRWGPRLRITQGDSGTQPLGSGNVDVAITSPPYVNGMDYPMNYKIEMAWLGLVRGYGELKRLRETMVACDNTPSSAVSDDTLHPLVARDGWIRQVRRSIRENIRRKSTYRRPNMDAIVARYFSDLVPVIQNVHRSLKPGSRFLVVNGDSLMAGAYVPGDAIFVRLARDLGFQVESFAVARTRRSGQRRGFVLRETIATLRKAPAT